MTEKNLTPSASDLNEAFTYILFVYLLLALPGKTWCV